QLVGYSRFEGEAIYRQLTSLYRTVRLYVNFFQPCLKLVSKEREGSKVKKKYDKAQTPYQRLLTEEILSKEDQKDYAGFYQNLNPVDLLSQINTAREKLCNLFG